LAADNWILASEPMSQARSSHPAAFSILAECRKYLSFARDGPAVVLLPLRLARRSRHTIPGSILSICPACDPAGYVCPDLSVDVRVNLEHAGLRSCINPR